jgi:hypothetical protein
MHGYRRGTGLARLPGMPSRDDPSIRSILDLLDDARFSLAERRYARSIVDLTAARECIRMLDWSVDEEWIAECAARAAARTVPGRVPAGRVVRLADRRAAMVAGRRRRSGKSA